MFLSLNRLLLLTILLGFSFISAQNKMHAKVVAIKNDKSLNTHKKIVTTNTLLKDSDFLNNSENISDVHHQIGVYYAKIKNYTQAVAETKKAIHIRAKIPELEYKLDNSLFNISQMYLLSMDFKKQRFFLNRIIKNNNKNRFTYKAYNKLALILKSNGDYFKALQYLKVIIDSYDNYNDVSILSIAYKNAILIYSQIENLTENDLKTLLKYSKAFEKNSSTKSKRLEVFNSLAIIYRHIKDYDVALKWLYKALPIALQLKKNNKIATIYSNIAAVESLKGNHKLANKYYNKALNITNNPTTVADIYYNQGLYLQTKTSIEKNKYYDKALLTALRLSKISVSIGFLPSIDDIKNSQYKIDILGYLIDKADNFVIAYNEEHKTIYLEYAINTLYLIDQLVSLIRFESSNNDSKLFWINKGVNSYMLAVKVCYLLKNTDAAFYFMEKNKSLLLLENLNTTQEKARLHIPDSILKREFNLRYAILSLENKRRKTPNDKNLTKLYLEKENAYTIFLDTLKTKYPAYFKSKKEPKILSLQEARKKHVSKTTNYVEYILNDKSGYGLFCSNDSTVLFEIQKIPELLNALDTLKNQISRPIIYKNDNKQYSETAYYIFKKVLPFKNALEIISNKKLVVVPDYKLKNLPFEALITQKNDTDFTQEYLIKHNVEISYYQSASVFQQIEKQNRTAKKKLIGFAPVTFNYDALPSLKRSKTEMDHISSLLPTTLLSKEEATTSAFISSLNDYNIVHINTHAGIHKENGPWIAFSDKKIHLKELYGINNQANLVVLDACKSASGTLLKGEGVMSLSRGFFYSGAKSVIASLWNVNEKSNNKILISFYNGIKQGQTKSEALHNAKLNYLNNHQNSELSPYFWSSLILTGDATAINVNDTSYLYYIVIGVSLLILILFLAKIKRVLLTK